MFSLGGPSLLSAFFLLGYRVGDIYNHVCLLTKRKEKSCGRIFLLYEDGYESNQKGHHIVFIQSYD